MKRLAVYLVAVLGIFSLSWVSGCSSSSDADEASVYQGTLSGTWQGSGMSGTFTVTVAADGTVSGTYAGDDAGTITGTVDSGGSFSASAAGQAGIATWVGSLVSANGRLSSGSGTWSAPGASGTWIST